MAMEASRQRKAVDLFRINLEQLYGYLYRLNHSDLPYRPSRTGVGQEAMFAILQNIDSPLIFRRSSLKELGEIYRSERDKEPLIENIKRIRTVIEEMRKAFL